jgi:uncharacterized protein YgiM (DUF1202 family)
MTEAAASCPSGSYLHYALETVNIRSGAFMSRPVVGTIYKGETVCVYDNATGDQYTACGTTSKTWAQLSAWWQSPRYAVDYCLRPVY